MSGCGQYSECLLSRVVKLQHYVDFGSGTAMPGFSGPRTESEPVDIASAAIDECVQRIRRISR